MNKLLDSSSSEYDSSTGSQPIPKAKEEDETDAFRGIEFDYISESKTPPKMENEKTEQGMKTYSLSIIKRYVWNVGMKNKKWQIQFIIMLGYNFGMEYRLKVYYPQN